MEKRSGSRALIQSVDDFEVRTHGDKPNVAWGNLFLTDNFVIHLDWQERQHDSAMAALGIDFRDVLVSASITKTGMAIRGSSGCYRQMPQAEFARLFDMVETRVFGSPRHDRRMYY